MLDLLFHAFYIIMPLLWKNSNYAVAAAAAIPSVQ